MIGGATALVLAAIVVIAVRAARPGALRLGVWEWLAAVLLVAGLGSLVGAALTPETPAAERSLRR